MVIFLSVEDTDASMSGRIVFCLLVAANVDLIEDSYGRQTSEALGLSKTFDEETHCPLSVKDATPEIHFYLFQQTW